MRLLDDNPGLGFIQFAAGGEATTGYVNGSVSWYERPGADKSQRETLMTGDGTQFAQPFVSQQAAALSFIQNHNIKLVTMSLGGNDNNHALWGTPAQRDPVLTRLKNLIQTLRNTAGSNVPIVAPNQHFAWASLNNLIGNAYRQGGATGVADVAEEFGAYDSTNTVLYNGVQTPRNEAGRCLYSLDCAKSDQHPSLWGYNIMADLIGEIAFGQNYTPWTDMSTPTGAPSAVDPNGVIVVALGSGTKISWGKPLREGSSPVIGYKVLVQDPGLSTGRYCTVDGSTTLGSSYRSCVIPNLAVPAAADRRVIVRAVNGEKESTLDGWTAPGTVGVGISTFQATTADAQTNVTWTPPNWSGGVQITGYEATATTPATTTQPEHTASCSTDGNGRSCLITGLTNGRTYLVNVRASNLVGTNDAPAVTVSVTPNGPQVVQPVTPGGLTATANTQTRVTINWNSVPDAQQYILRRNGEVISEQVATTFTDNSLSPNTEYTYSVAARNISGTSLPSTGVTVRTLPLLPTTPRNFTSVADSQTKVTLRWDTSPDADRYQLRRGSDIIYVGSATSVTDENLEPNTYYWYRLNAINDGGKSDGSAGSGVTTHALPPTVTSPLATKVRANSAVLSAIVESSGVAADVTFNVSRNADMSNATSFVGSPEAPDSQTSTATATGLNGGVKYYYQVLVRNEQGYEAHSAVLNLTTPSTATSTTGDATNVVNRSAILHGTVLGNGNDPTTVQIAYGTTMTSYVVVNAREIFDPASLNNQPASTVINHLTPGVTYGYRLIVTNKYGTTVSPIKYFVAK